jgi:hypothetical protein
MDVSSRDTVQPGCRVARDVKRLVVLNALYLLPAGLLAQYPHVELTGQLPPVLSESSGVAVSRTNPGVLWTHNDSDNDPVLYAVDITGRLLGTFTVESATVRDWEDISVGPCVMDRTQQCLYVAETGDNSRQETVYTIYIVAEPVITPDKSVASTTNGTVLRLDFGYPDGSHDAEALAVHPGGDIYIFTKGWAGIARGFFIPRAAVERAVNSRTAVMASALEDATVETGGIPFMVTGAAISPTGTTMVIRTYLGFHFFDVHQAGGLEPRGEPCMIGYREPQGEAVDFMDDRTLVLTSESLVGRPGTIHRVRCEGE